MKKIFLMFTLMIVSVAFYSCSQEDESVNGETVNSVELNLKTGSGVNQTGSSISFEENNTLIENEVTAWIRDFDNKMKEEAALSGDHFNQFSSNILIPIEEVTHKNATFVLLVSPSRNGIVTMKLTDESSLRTYSKQPTYALIQINGEVGYADMGPATRDWSCSGTYDDTGNTYTMNCNSNGQCTESNNQQGTFPVSYWRALAGCLAAQY